MLSEISHKTKGGMLTTQNWWKTVMEGYGAGKPSPCDRSPNQRADTAGEQCLAKSPVSVSALP